ncbi:MAG TPA: (d)CMP kinase [Fimbriimonadaceae bacterium]
MDKLVIAIDGPAGSGKTTIAKKVSHDLDLRFLDTGAMYRCVALKCIRNGITADQAGPAAAIAESSEIRFGAGEPQRVFLDGEDVTDAIRKPEIGDFASAVSVHSAVRRQLVQQQKQIVKAGGVILEGRDTTTVVAPNAQVKIFLTASIDVRANRRYKELVDKGMDVNLEEIKSQIEERDLRDSTREDSPLQKAPDATEIDSGGLSIEEVLSRVEQLASKSEV